MRPSGYIGQYNSRQSIPDRSSTQVKVSSPASSSRPQQQTPPGGAFGDSSRITYLRDTIEHESVIGQLLSPPTPPSPLVQVLSAGPSHSSSHQPDAGVIPSPNSNSGYQSLYDDIKRELFAEPSSSPQQSGAGAIATPHTSSYNSLYDGFTQAPSSSSGQQSAASESTSRTYQKSYSRYPGVTYHKARDRWRVRWVDPSIGRQIFLGSSYRTQSEAIKKLEDYKASRNELLSQTTPHPGVYPLPSGRWMAKYYIKGEQVYLGTFGTKGDAAKAVSKSRAERRLPPMVLRKKEKT